MFEVEEISALRRMPEQGEQKPVVSTKVKRYMCTSDMYVRTCVRLSLCNQVFKEQMFMAEDLRLDLSFITGDLHPRLWCISSIQSSAHAFTSQLAKPT